MNYKSLVVSMAAISVLTGCVGTNPSLQGAVIGGVAGGAIGAAVSSGGATLKGAAIGAGIGAATGAIIGGVINRPAPVSAPYAYGPPPAVRTLEK